MKNPFKKEKFGKKVKYACGVKDCNARFISPFQLEFHVNTVHTKPLFEDKKDG